MARCNPLPPKKTPQKKMASQKSVPKFCSISSWAANILALPPNFPPPNPCLMYYMFRTRHLNSHVHTTGIHLSDGARTLQHVLVHSGDQQRNSSEPGRQRCIDPNKETQDKYRFCRFCCRNWNISLTWASPKETNILR